MPTVAAVVVTRNRPGLLARCLAAIYAQSYTIAYVVVVDNASDQATRNLLAAEACSRTNSKLKAAGEETRGLLERIERLENESSRRTRGRNPKNFEKTLKSTG